MRLLKADFKVTGCEDEADEATRFTGIQVRRDWARQTVTLHQTEFTERLLAKHGLEGGRIEPMPYKTKHQLEPWTGDAVSEAEHFDYMSLIGDLVWLCKTRVDIAWRVSLHETPRPGPLRGSQVRATVPEGLPGRWSDLSWIGRGAQPELRPPEQDHPSHGRRL
jgi:hypothetical protein